MEVRDVVFDIAFVTLSVRNHQPGFGSIPMKLVTVLLHQSPEAAHRWAVLKCLEPRVNANIGEVNLELALLLDKLTSPRPDTQRASPVGTAQSGRRGGATLGRARCRNFGFLGSQPPRWAASAQ